MTRATGMVACGIVWAIVGVGVREAAAQDASTTLHLCTKTQTGQVRVVPSGQACLPSETAVDVQTGSAGGPLHLVDSADNDLGPYEFFLGGAGIRVPRPNHDGQWLTLPVPKSTGPIASLQLYFTTPCAAGHALTDGYWFGAAADQLVRVAVAIGGTLYYGGDTATTIHPASSETITADGTRTCSDFTFGFPASTVSNLETATAPSMTPPFRLVAK